MQIAGMGKRITDLTLELSTDFVAPPSGLWAYLTDIAHMCDFQGYGPIPGIESARWIDADRARLGAIREIRNRDGSTHREELVRFEPERLMEDRIYDFDLPVRLLLNEMRDSFELIERDGGTRLHRRVTFDIRSPLLWPVAWALRSLFHRAATRHHLRIASRIDGQQS